MEIRLSPFILIMASLFLFLLSEAKTMDPYKVLGVERNASQREIQKAFHKLSLQYHPDKNKKKSAQHKFEEINNAYEILSDEEKRKNFDLYGDEKGSPGFGPDYSGDQGGGHTFFTNEGRRQGQQNFKPQWQGTGGQGGSQSFSFSFGGPSGGSNPFGFGMEDIFSNFFGGGFKDEGNFGSHFKAQSGSKSSSIIKVVNKQVFKQEVVGQGVTWLLFPITSSLKGVDHVQSIIEDVASSLQGALKAGRIDCESESSLCKDLGIYPHRTPRIFVYSYIKSTDGSLVEYSGDVAVKNLKSFCQEHFPRFSRRVDLRQFDFSSNNGGRLPTLMLLSTKKDTPVIWRVLSGMYNKQFSFYDAEVTDVSDPTIKKLGVDALPAIVGWLSNGERHVLRTGINVKDLRSAIDDLSYLLDGFEKKNRKAASKPASKTQSDSAQNRIPLLTGSNFDSICGKNTPVCVIGAFKSSKARNKLEMILNMVSQKTLSRRQISAPSSKESISYSLVDATKQPSFLKAFDSAGFKSSDQILIAYKRRKEKFAAHLGEMTEEEVEKFIGSVLNGDITFTKTRQKPVLK
ncbi:dnaJ protein ERDJ3A [Cucurbita pepo subsp. pepo]|uniref:dnaJ protein ERDJ3A n=1 Tax=Cucurbita pepo subsp. pepo TaxID=3664 RepID=UPI000C9D6E6E|nr:dnaJ protein ERDJ3A [Cucurbita pepo subsp. pepo]